MHPGADHGGIDHCGIDLGAGIAASSGVVVCTGGVIEGGDGGVGSDPSCAGLFAGEECGGGKKGLRLLALLPAALGWWLAVGDGRVACGGDAIAAPNGSTPGSVSHPPLPTSD